MDLNYSQWKDMIIEGVTGEFADLNFFDLQPRSSTSTRNTLSVNSGAEYLFIRDRFVIPLRFGIAYSPEEINARFGTP